MQRLLERTIRNAEQHSNDQQDCDCEPAQPRESKEGR